MNDRSEINKFLSAARTWWWLILLFAAAAATASYIYSTRQAKVYEATATVVVGQSIQVSDPTTQDIDTSRRLAQTYALIIRRQPIMQAVVDAQQLEMSWRELRSRTRVYLVPTTQLIEVTVEADSPEQSRLLADEIAQQFILYSPTLDINLESDETKLFIEDRLARLKEKIISSQAEIDLREQAYLRAGQESEREAIRREISRLEGFLSTWESNYSRLLIVNDNKEASNFVIVIEPAQASSNPVRPDVRMNVLLASVVGVLLGLAVVFLMDSMDETIKSERALEKEGSLTPLGMVNLMTGKEEAERLITGQEPFSTAQEAYRVIRSNIQFLAVERPAKTLMITSACTGDGKSLTAANLSLSMAQAGLKTILVDADLRQPKQHTLFKMNNVLGLADLLMVPQLDIARVLKSTTLDNLHVLTSGMRPSNPTELLGSASMVQLLTKLSGIADVIILDSMPALPVADTAILSNRVDGVVMVVDSTHTRKSDLKEAMQILEKAHAKILGGILNRVPGRKTRYHTEYNPHASRKNIPARASIRE